MSPLKVGCLCSWVHCLVVSLPLLRATLIGYCWWLLLYPDYWICHPNTCSWIHHHIGLYFLTVVLYSSWSRYTLYESHQYHLYPLTFLNYLYTLFLSYWLDQSPLQKCQLHQLVVVVIVCPLSVVYWSMIVCFSSWHLICPFC